MEGWIKIHRKINNRWWRNDPNTFSLFLYLLSTANTETKQYQWYTINKGDCIVWRKSLSKILGISERWIRTSINHLKTTNETTIKTTNKFTIITICKWEEYQLEYKNRPPNRPPKTPTTDQQPTTPKEEQEEKNIEIPEFLQTTLKEFIAMRNKIKKPMTDKAITMLLNKLNELGKSDGEKIMILEQSIFHCRQGIFPLKDEYKLDDPKIFKRYVEEWKTDYLKSMMGMEKFSEAKNVFLTSNVK